MRREDLKLTSKFDPSDDDHTTVCRASCFFGVAMHGIAESPPFIEDPIKLKDKYTTLECIIFLV